MTITTSIMMRKKLLLSLFTAILIYSCSKNAEEIEVLPVVDPAIANCINFVPIARFPKGRLEATAFTLNGKGYVGLGTNTCSSDPLKDFWRYDEVENSWERMPDFPIGSYAAMSFVIGDTAYVGGGIYFDKSGERTVARVSKRFFAYYETSPRWIEKDSISIGRAASAAFSDGQNGYLIGGAIGDETGDIDGANRYDDRVYKYSQATNKWEIANQFPKPINVAAGITSNNGRHFVFGGLIDTLSIIHEYLPNDTWSSKAVKCFDDNLYTYDFISFAENNNIYFGLGGQLRRDTFLPRTLDKSLWKYNMDTNICEELCVRKDLEVDLNFEEGISFSIGNNHYMGLGRTEGRNMYQVVF